MSNVFDYSFTSKEQMRKLTNGDIFWVNKECHQACGDSHLSGDSTCEEYIVYDENGDCWFENDFVDVMIIK